MLKGLFTTITNVNFHNATIEALKAEIEAEKAKIHAGRVEDYELRRLWEADEDIRSLKSLVLFGLKGMAAYAYHARILGGTDDEVNRAFAKIVEALRALLGVEVRDN